ncbi:MAG: GNAT family N-acetyltransferase [Bacilli bacterium]|jgi:phosphinothricin acetyltransferase|nr:GNAT family N-acetyltransferase [Bacilli bacterium]
MIDCNKIIIRLMMLQDWPFIKAIYQEGILSNNATFQTAVPSYQEWDHNHLSQLRYVACFNNEVIGFVALSLMSAREVYAGVCEVSIYIKKAFHQQGVGKILLSYVIEQAEMKGIWTLYANIIAENIGSIKLHQACGFRIVGYRDKIARDRKGQWRNTILLEKRSTFI